MITDEFTIICSGIKIGSIYIPKFKARKGQLLCFHWPLPGEGLEEKHFRKMLLGTATEVNLQIFGKTINVAKLLYNDSTFKYTYQQSIEKFLLEFGNINIEIVNNILMKLNIIPHSFIDSVSLTTKILLGIELAWLDFPDILLFETSGLDPLGINTVCEAILEKLDICTFIHLSYPTYPTRLCCSQSQCIEIHKLIND